ncbi:MAG: viral A-type inclusion protein [Chitinophagaceae bacterium]|nr:viral A-type inclusion protein [Chitinophagaceae bacterium]
MKKLILLLVSTFLLFACNNDDKHNHTGSAPKTEADSLMHDVMEGHDVGMGKMPKLSAAQKQAQQWLDSIAKLPAKAQQAAAPLKAKIDSLAKDLSYAEFAMNKWMEEFNMDSSLDNAEQRIKYLADEKMKVGKVKEAILGSLAKADSLLKAKL